ncbi:MAG: cysteine hydrolase [Actinomycetota bacterium]|nr:cysteine hydrolase [Actinomycetota bacterium]
MASADRHVEPHYDRCALLVIDTQVDFTEGGASPIAGTAAVVPEIVTLLEAFRGAGRPIVHVVRLYAGEDVDRVRRTVIAEGAAIVAPGSAGSEIVPALRPAGADSLDPERLVAGELQELGPNETAIFKPRWSAFHRTQLEAYLIERGVDTVVVAGCNFPNCPRATAFDASQRDFRVVLATDAISGIRDGHLREMAGIGVLSEPTGALCASMVG